MLQLYMTIDVCLYIMFVGTTNMCIDMSDLPFANNRRRFPCACLLWLYTRMCAYICECTMICPKLVRRCGAPSCICNHKVHALMSSIYLLSIFMYCAPIQCTLTQNLLLCTFAANIITCLARIGNINFNTNTVVFVCNVVVASRRRLCAP